MFKSTLPIVFALFQVLKANKPSAKLCVRADQNCRDDVFMCGPEYGRFKLACDLAAKPMSTRSNENWTNLQPPTAKPCSKDCVEAIEHLKSTKRGMELHECDCQLDGDCLIVKARVAKCLNTSQDRRSGSCTLALWNCTRDPTCRFLQSKFLEDCREMFNGVRCERKCLRIQDRLFRSTYGKALAHCECDGLSEAYCRAIQGHAKQLRCLPGMDGKGTPAFTYVDTSSLVDTDPGIIHGEVEENNEQNHTVNCRTPSILTLALSTLTLFLHRFHCSTS